MSLIRTVVRKKMQLLRGMLLLALLSLIGTCQQASTELEKVLDRGTLKVATRNAPTVYYLGADGPTGYDYDLLAGFADFLGVELDLIVPPNFSEILPLVIENKVNVAAAGLSVTPERRNLVRFGFPVLEVNQAVVYKAGNSRPRTESDLVDREIEVIAGSSHAERLNKLKRRLPGISWSETPTTSSDQLLYRVAKGELELTIADSHVLLVNQRFYPQLRKGFNLGVPENLAWAFPKEADDSLYNQAVDYFNQLRQSGELRRLRAQHFGHVERLDYTGAISFSSQVRKRLPKYQDMFIAAETETGLDWRLLAAVGYQESHWNPNARSPTGVRGLMMLTNRTAKELGVTNRRDAEQSIMGGSRYLANLHGRVPKSVGEPDRTWFTLAAYNIGLGHVLDARRLARELDLDPDLWLSLRKVLPLLNQSEWHQKTRYGYARGREAVEYVENIRSYYDVLVWMNKDPGNEIEVVPDLPEPLVEEIPLPQRPEDAAPRVDVDSL